MIWFVIYLVVLLVSSFICYGWYFAYFQKEYPLIAKNYYKANISDSIIFGLMYGLFGPLGILITLLDTKCAKHGWKFR